MSTIFKTTAFLFVAILFSASKVFSQNSFTEYVFESQKQNTFQFVHWFDENGDGLMDFIFERDDQIYLNNGDRTFSPSTRVVPETGYVWHLTDLDKNGKIDFLNSIGISEVYAMMNLENGSFRIDRLPIDPDYSYYQWIDVDGDGDLDYTYSSQYLPREPFSNKLWAYINDNGKFNKQENYNHTIRYESNDRVYVSDIDKDGDFDMLVSNHDQKGPVRIYTCLEPYKFELDTIFDLPEGYNGKIYLQDVNNDGYEDFLHTNSYGTQLFINDQGKFSQSSQVFNYGWGNYADWGDYNNDGFLDFVYSQCSSGHSKMSIFKNKKDGTFEEILFTSKNYESIRAKWIDIDNDGFLDLSVENYICKYWENYCGQPYQIQFFINNREGLSNSKPAAPENLKIDFSSERIEWDISADNETPSSALNYNLHLYTNALNHVFPPINFATGNPLILAKPNLRTNNFYDLSYLAPGNYSARVQSIDGGKRHSLFTSQVQFEIGAAPANLMLNNLQLGEVTFSWENQTTYDEIVIERACANGPYSEIAVIPGHNQSFTDNTTSIECDEFSYRVKGRSSSIISAYSEELKIDAQMFSAKYFDFESDFWNAYDIIWADIDLDGDIDPVAYQYPNINIYRNDGNGDYSLISSLENPGRYFPSLDWCDINNDNLPDISAHHYDEGLFFFTNEGSGNFQLINIENPFPPMSKLVDIDLDGIDEVIFVDETQVKYLELDETSPHTFFEFENEMEERYQIFTHDVNADQIPDILFLSSNSQYLLSENKLEYVLADLPDSFQQIDENFNLQNSIETDIDQDGIIDLVFSYVTTTDHITHVGYLSHDENGTLEFHNIKDRPRYNPILFACDFDNNGTSDILIQAGYVEEIEKETSPVLYLQKNDVFAFEELVEYMEVSDLLEVTDYDQDGDLDILCHGMDQESRSFSGMVIENRASDFHSVANNSPSPPDMLELNVDSTHLTISWNLGADDLTNPKSLTYNYFLVKDGDFLHSPLSDLSDGTRFVQRSGKLGTSRKMKLEGLKSGSYSFGVQSIDNGFLGSIFSDTVRFTIEEPPVLDSIQQLNATTVSIHWMPDSNVKGFIVKRSENSIGPYQIVAKLSGNETSFQDHDLSRNQLFYYKISSFGEGVFSEELEVPYYNSDFTEMSNSDFPTDSAFKIVPCDVNRDGYMDLVGLYYDHAAILSNDGTGKFSKSDEIKLTFTNPLDLVVTDLNNDNFPDFAMISHEQKGVTIALQKDNGRFELIDQDINVYWTPHQLVTADFTNDGKVDLLVNHILLWMENGEIHTSQFLENNNIIDNYFPYINAIDIDLDRDTDIVYGTKLRWIQNDHPLQSSDISLCLNCNRSVSGVEDFDGNGNWDIINFGVRDYNYADGMLFLNHGDLYFTKQAFPGTRFENVSMTIGDVDNNGFPDMIASGMKDYPYEQAEHFAYFNNKNNGFEEMKLLKIDTCISELHLVDIDDDQDLDLLLNTSKERGIKVFLNTMNHIIIGRQNAKPEAPENLEVQIKSDTIMLSWDAGSDLETNKKSLTYNIKVMNGEGEYVVSPLSNDNGAFSQNRQGNAGLNTSWEIFGVAPGEYSWAVQSIDASLNYSTFSEINSFTVLEEEELITGLTDQNQIDIYPNPATESLNIILNSHCKNLCITDLLGKMVYYEENCFDLQREPSKVIDLKQFNNGIYILSIETENGYQSRKFVKE